MKRIAIITAYFASICILGCLAAYPIYLLTGADLERIVSRSILILAILLFYPTCRLLNVQAVNAIGQAKQQLSKTLLRSWSFGFIMLVPISIVYLYCGYRIIEDQPITIYVLFSALFSALLSGLLIGIIEESIFRGLLQSQLSQSINTIAAVFIVSIIYSSVHFLQAEEHVATTVTWLSGFDMLSSAFANLKNIHLFVDAWLALFLAGIFLSLIRIATNNIVWCIGIHAGWVAHIKLFKEFTDRNNQADCASLASNYDNYVGELSTLLILLILSTWAIKHFRQKKL